MFDIEISVIIPANHVVTIEFAYIVVKVPGSQVSRSVYEKAINQKCIIVTQNKIRKMEGKH